MSELKKVPLIDIYIDEEFNSRDQINFTQVVDLAKSIKKDGLIQPILLMPLNKEGKKYMIVAGHRRFKAFMILSNDDPAFKEIPAIIREDLDEQHARVLNLNENLARKNLNILEEAMALVPLMKLGMSESQMVEAIPTASRGWVQVRCMLLKLPKEVRDEAAMGFLTIQQIRDLYTLKFNGETDEVIYNKVKEAKEAKSRGELFQIKKRKKDDLKKPPGEQKHNRNRHEIFVMIDHLLSNKVEGLTTRALAWAAGEISDMDFFFDIKEFVGQEYEINRLGLDYSKVI
jgi:ParB family chromosome partitioning protein